jgi:ectoine hydroxylase
MISLCRDPYPSRAISDHLLARRLEPVIWSEDSERPAWLSPEQAQQYADDGYLVLDDFLSRQQVIELLAARSVCLDKHSVARNLEQQHHAFAALASSPKLLELMRYVLASEVYLHQSSAHADATLKGQQQEWRSDFEIWHIEDGMPQMRAVQCFVVLDQPSRFHAPLQVLPGSHKTYVGRPNNELAQESIAMLSHQNGGEEALEPMPGSLIVMDSNILHTSEGQHLAFAFNSLDNSLTKPAHGLTPRPEELATRTEPNPL